MHLTNKEIFAQYAALRTTYDYILENKQRITALFTQYQPKSLTFLGCGSGYYLCQSGAVSARMRLGIPANAIPAGDLWVNFTHYSKMLQDTLIIAPSRSGGTTEVVEAVKKLKEQGLPVSAISAKTGSELAELADLVLEIPWAFDESVCQTRNVTNFYTVNLMLVALWGSDVHLLEEIKQAISAGEAYMEQYKSLAEEIAAREWQKAVLLADSELEGIGAEAALAFTEIAQIPGAYHHVLDVRHGPMVLINHQTLVIMAVSPEETRLQQGLVQDLRQRGALVVTVSQGEEQDLGAHYTVHVPKYRNFAVMGIPFIFIPQTVAYFKAVARGVNPDAPGGLDPWIDLSKDS